jgi:multimeric flavodoxin WrbA
MNICILNGNPQGGANGFDAYLRNLAAELDSRGHRSEEITLRDLEIRSCQGCFGCWLKTPGECVLADDGAQVCRAALRSDLLILASPLVMGFVSARLKICLDRLIPIIHPYITLVRGECHHRARYERYPQIALLTAPEENGAPEDLEITAAILARTALNMKSRLALVKTTEDDEKEVADELVRV